MISIVAHGIMGTTYRQDVVVGEGIRENGSLQVLHDIRRQLSTQYGDEIPMTGWALQPAPTGIWLSRIERAFDANYIPAYVMVSFLIPQDHRLRTESLQRIEHTMVVNHMNYMQQSVVLHKPDWSFLHLLGRELEGLLVNATNATPYQWEPVECNAYWSGDMPSMLNNLWDKRFLQFNIIYCGNRFLSVDKEFFSIESISFTNETMVGQDEILNEATEPQMDLSSFEESESPSFENNSSVDDEVAADSYSSIENTQDALSQKQSDIIGSVNCTTHGDNFKQVSKVTIESTKVNRPQKKQKKDNDTLNILLIFGALLVVFLIYSVINGSFTNNNNSNSSVSSDDITEYAEEAIPPKEDHHVNKTTETEKAKEFVTPTDEDNQIIEINNGNQVIEVVEQNDEKAYTNPKEEIVEKDEIEEFEGRIYIATANELFHCLTWENIKDNGMLFYERYMINDKLTMRARCIIDSANKIGKEKYVMEYNRAKVRGKRGMDCLTYLEMSLGAL